MRAQLAGRTVVVTRARAQAAELVEELESRGAEVVSFPTIRIADPADLGAVAAAAAAVGEFDLVVFTSANAVERFFAALPAERRSGEGMPAGLAVCAVGSATAAAVERWGWRAALVPDEFVAEALVAALETHGSVRGRRVLFPRAEQARPVVGEALRAAGAELHEVIVYRTVPDGEGAEMVRRRLADETVDYITFTSGSTVRGFVDLVGTGIGRARVACIGPVTGTVARELGLPVHVTAAEYTAGGLVRAIVDDVMARR